MITLTTGNEEDWAKEERRVEIHTEERFGFRPGRPHYFADTRKEDILHEIEAENVRASNERINSHE
jgi:hypothetical protein